MGRSIGLAGLEELGSLALASSADAIEAMCRLVQRLSGVDFTVVSEVTEDGRYVFRGLEHGPAVALTPGGAIPWESSLCSRVHAGESPATVPETRDVPALWTSWLRLKEGIGVEWDVRAFCTREVRLPDASLFGTLCLHHCEPRTFSSDEEALLEVVARLLGQARSSLRSARSSSARRTVVIRPFYRSLTRFGTPRKDSGTLAARPGFSSPRRHS